MDLLTLQVRSNTEKNTCLLHTYLLYAHLAFCSADFPLPMRSNEAGPCPCVWGTSTAQRQQHRYLWTDAFAVLAYQTLAEHYTDEKSRVYSDAVDKLIQVVHECLGKPRSERDEDKMTPSEISLSGYVGLRIGKVESRKVTDYGMHYDGMYWHYVDKWLLALARTNHVEEGIRIAKSIFPYFFSSSKYGGGIRWKLSVDASAPPALQDANANDDTLNALIVFSMLNSKRNQSTKMNLNDEIASLQTSLRNYRPRVTDDPLGFGLECLFDQFVMGHPRTEQLRKVAPGALHPSHLSLPFRLYGALIGALVVPSSAVGNKVSPEYLQQLTELCVKYQLDEIKKESGRYEEEHSSINRTMLAMALLSPGVLKRRDSDPLVKL